MSFLENLGRNPLDRVADKIAGAKGRAQDAKQNVKDKIKAAKCDQLGCKGKRGKICPRCGAKKL